MRLYTFVLLLLLQPGMVSRFLSEKEAYQSSGHPHIVCVPSSRQKAMVEKFGREYFDSLRIAAGTPLYVSSMFRCPELNKAVQGAKNSDHMMLSDVVACDIDQDGRKTKINNRSLFFLIKERGNFFKAIWEFGDLKNPSWVHVSYSTDPEKNKMQKMYRAIKVGNRTVYRLFDQI